MDSGRIGAGLLAFIMTLGLTLPSSAQTTMLTGSAVTAVPVMPTTTTPYQTGLVRQNATFDTRPVTVVHPHPHPVSKTVYLKDNRTFFQRHPMVKGATIGAGLGGGIGAATGLITHRGVLRGAAIGAGTGAGVGMIRTSQIMKRHPIMRDVATGSVAGLGLGWAGSRRKSTMAKTAGVGAALGLGVGLLKNLK